VGNKTIQNRTSKLKTQVGAAYIEYVVSTLILVILLFSPLPGLDHSIVDYVMDSIRDFNRNSSYLLSLP